jgi:hypothetical protein
MITGMSGFGQGKYEVSEITELDCTFSKNYFDLTGPSYFLSKSECKLRGIEYDDMVEYSRKGKIRGTNMIVIEELHFHEAFTILVDSTHNTTLRIKGDILLSKNMEYFTAYVIGSEGTEDGLEIWKTNNWNPIKIFEITTPGFRIGTFCWNDEKEFQIEYKVSGETRTEKYIFKE